MLEPRSDHLRPATSLLPAKVIPHTSVKIEIAVSPDASDESEKRVHIVTNTHLGEGAFGVVLGGIMTETWKQADGSSAEKITEVAVKCSQKKVQRKDLDRLKEEVKTMSLFTHPNIVKYHFACTYHDYIYIIMEKCERCNLHEAIKLNDGHLSMQDILCIGYQIVDALTHVHSMGCIHRDVKPGNFVFDRCGNVKLTDFGLSSMVQRPDSNDGVNPKSLPEKGEVKCENANRRTVAGTYSYMAPEIMKQVILHRKNKHMEKGFRYGVEVDVYSLGVLLFFLATRTSPYWNSIREIKRKDSPEKADSTRVLCEAVSEGRWQWPLSTKFRMESIDTDFRKLVESMLSFSGSGRPSLWQIREHVLWERRPQAISAKLLNIIRNGTESTKVKSLPYSHVNKRTIEKLEQEEEFIRSGFTKIRAHYCALMSLQGRELAQRAHIISEHLRGVALLRNTEKEERKHNRVGNDLTFLGNHSINDLEEVSRRAQDNVENSGRYSFRASTLAAWSVSSSSPKQSRRKSKPLDSSPVARGQTQRATRKANASETYAPSKRHQSRAPEWNHTPRQRSLRSYDKSSTSKVRRTPSFWLDGPSQKFIAVPSPTFDMKKDQMKCPKKHAMTLLRKFPALNETIEGTNDYGWGFWCDHCHKEVPSLAGTRKRGRSPKVDQDRLANPEKNTFFYHCHCGYDLCKACGASIMKTADPALANVASQVNKDPVRSDDMAEAEKPTANTPSLGIFDQQEDSIQPFNLDIPSNEYAQPRPTFVPQKTQEPPSVECYSPQPSPHSPSHIVDKRFALLPTDEETQPKKSLRMWWEPNSPFASDVEAPAEVLAHDDKFSLPRPHQVMPDSLSQFNTLLGSPILSAVKPSNDHTTEAEEEKPRKESKGKKYVNTIRVESENHPAKSPVEKEIPKEILNGDGWIWHYEIQQENNIIYILYMCSEVCFGCLIMNTMASVQSAMIYDKSKGVVFFVPQIEQRERKGPSRNYTHPHPYIATHYKDSIIMFREIDVLRMSADPLEEAKTSKSTPGRRNTNIYESFNLLPQYLSILKGYVNGLEDRKLPFDSPKHAKLFYLRKFFYDYTTEEEPEWYMFRLSNGHTVISSPKENTQIRWLAMNDTAQGGQSSEVVDKYIFQGDEVRPYNNLEYFRKVRSTLQQFDGHSHDDL